VTWEQPQKRAVRECPRDWNQVATYSPGPAVVWAVGEAPHAPTQTQQKPHGLKDWLQKALAAHRDRRLGRQVAQLGLLEHRVQGRPDRYDLDGMGT
jgi:hypothetical protein